MIDLIYDVVCVCMYFQGLQIWIVDVFGVFDGILFVIDMWQCGLVECLCGGGCMWIFEGGCVFECVGIGFFDVVGDVLLLLVSVVCLQFVGCGFEVFGVLFVLYLCNLYCLIVYMNVWMLIVMKFGEVFVFWFGGGMDLILVYGFEDDVWYFYQICKDVFDLFGIEFYLCFKQWCDEYFFLKYCNEMCGIGGIFFDDFLEFGFECLFDLM